MAILKEYYRLEEANRKFGFTDDDLRYHIDNRDIQLAFFLPVRKYIIGGYLSGKGFFGTGVVSYEGLVTISSPEQQRLIEVGKVFVSAVSLLSKSKIHYESADYPFDIQLPTACIYKWLPRKPDEFEWEHIPAIFYPRQAVSPAQALGALAEMIKSGGNVDADDDATLEETLLRQPVTLKLSDVCLPHSELVRLGYITITAETAESPVQESSTKSRNQVFKDDFDELLVNILRDNRGIRHKEVLRILTHEARQEEDERMYDRRNILLDEIEGRIVWRDHLGTKSEKAYSRKTIENRIAGLKKLDY